jgi:hypothetical protein
MFPPLILDAVPHACRHDIPVPLSVVDGIYVHSTFNVDIVSEQSAESFAIGMAEGFHVFVQDKVANSSDWVSQFAGQFILRTFDYLLMCQSEQLGDCSVVVEHCYARFLLVLSYTGKRNYFELC